MKKIAEKVAIAALICIAFVFVLTAILYVTGAINNYNTNEFYNENGEIIETPNNSIILTLMIVLAVVFVLVSLYVLYVNFAERENLRSVLLFCDSDSATRTNVKVINNIVKGCSNQVDGIKVRKIRVRSDEKGGLSATVYVKVDAEEVSEKINVLRCLLTDSFKNTLNLTFNTMNFQIDKLNGKYTPDIERAEEIAENLQEDQETMIENYHEPVTAQKTTPKADEAKKQEQKTEKEQKVEEADETKEPELV